MTEPNPARILVIDDEESMRDACTQVLTREGYQVISASDGEEGLSLAANDPPDIVFLDLKMPGLAGMAVLDEMKKAAPDAVKVVITAYATVSSALEAVRHGAYDFLPKPFTPEELRVVAGRALERRNLVLKNRRLESERDQAKHRFFRLITSEVSGPLAAARASLQELTHSLADRPEDRALARQAMVRLEKLMEMVSRWSESAAAQNNGE